MPAMYGTGSRLSKFWLHPIVMVFGLALTLAACQKGDSESSEDAGTPSAGDETSAATDSSMTEESPADSSDTADASSKSWKDKLFGGDDEEEEEEPAIPVETALASARDIPAYLSSTATLEPEKQADLVAQIEGTVLRIHVEEGDWVKEGQTLAELDGAAAAVELEEATARARGLQHDLERIEGLAKRELSSEKALQDARAAYEQAEAQRKGSALRHRYTKIRAPFGGVVSGRAVDPGQHVSAGATVFTLVDSSPLLARIYLPEREVLALAPDQQLWIEPDAEAELESKIPGSVLRIAPIVDTRTGTVKVTCQVDDDPDPNDPAGNHSADGEQESPLRPGSFVRVLIQTGIHEQVLTVPKRAIVPEGADTYVYRAEADSVVKVPVVTGFADNEFIEVIEGLDREDRIVTVGHGSLETGSRIDDLTVGAGLGEQKSAPLTDTAAKAQ